MEKYSQASLLQAMDRVRQGSMSIRQASKEYGVPYGTLGDKLRGRRPIETKPKFVLTPEEESKLANWIKELGRRGFGRTRDEIKEAVKRILDSRGATTKLKDNRPGKFWMANFFKRYPELVMRTPQALGKERALVTREGLDQWFKDFKAYITDQDPVILLCPDRIWNADESGFSLSTKAKKVVMEKGKKHAYQLTGNSKSQVTVLACHSASGQFLSPLIIYPYKRQPSLNLLEGFPEAHFQLSDNVWITAPIFHTWLRDIFIPGIEGRKRPVLLLVDGHSSHSALIETLTLCADNGIILYCLKAHSSHLIQPLDQAFFGAIKPAWEKASRQFLFDSGENVGLRTFASVLKKAWFSTATLDIALKGFSASGIYPFNPDKILSSDKLAPSLLFKSQAE